jgi:hypothetical protein
MRRWLLTGNGYQCANGVWSDLDGSVMGHWCVALMRHVIYTGHALTLVWQVRQGKKGHCPEGRHMALVEQLYDLIPPRVQVLLLGDGAFDGT